MVPKRPADDEVVAMVDALEWHIDHLLNAGAPTAALIVESVVRDMVDRGALASLLPANVRFGNLPALRVMAAVHRLALERLAPRVAIHLPTLGGTPPTTAQAAAEFADAVVQTLVDNEPVLRASIEHTPQTNEPRRSAVLRCALAQLDPAIPVRLREIGASGGINLRADHLPGLPGLESGRLPSILDRIGCDLHPIDPLSADGRLTLSSYVWVDDVLRFERLGEALLVAGRVPAVMVTQDAASFVRDLELADGSVTVLWHSAFWTYLPSASRSELTEAIDDVARTATRTAPFVHANWEFGDDTADRPEQFLLTVRTWSGGSADGQSRLVAYGDSHASSVTLASR